MRVLLDEHLPIDLAPMLQGHQVDSVVDRGWVGLKNGPLLQRMRGEYDVLLTMDRSLEFQQNITALTFGVLLVGAASNRMVHLVPLVPLVPSMLDVLPTIRPGQIVRIGR